MASQPPLGALPQILRCPFCDGRFSFEERPTPPFGRAEFGLLRCSCSVFPVVDGIPIIQRGPVGMLEHTRGTQQTESVSINTLVAQVERGDTSNALLNCLAVPESQGAWRSAIGWRLAHSRFASRIARALGNRKFRRHVLARRDTLGAREVLEFYYLSGGPLDPAMGHYFVRRFGQPRHLAALSLAATMASDAKPILDIACGIGHLEHYFGCRHDPAPVVGLDMNYYHLWIARHWMAPDAHFVCANADDGLPFADDSFASTVCSDAYHYIRNRRRLLDEIERCAVGRMVVLTRVGNAAVMPNEGAESTLADYLAEFGSAEVHAFDEAELLRRYLRRIDAFSPGPVRRDDLSESKWLSFAWNLLNRSKRSIASDAIAPHAVGQVGVNPIYSHEAGADGSLRLSFTFPMIWYAYENHAMLSYHPRVAILSPDELANLAAWNSRETLRTLVDSFVLLGLPHRFTQTDSSSASSSKS